VRIATATWAIPSIVIGAVVGLGILLDDHARPRLEPRRASRIDIPPPPPLEVEIEPSSSTVQHEPPAPPSPPFYASLFVAGATWTLPCTVGAPMREATPASSLRCRVVSVEVAALETRARIACGFVHEAEAADPDPAINTYLMTGEGLYRAASPSTRGEPMFRPHPVKKPLPAGWGQSEPDGPTHATAIVRHNGAWCSVSEFQSVDTSAGVTDCISSRGIVGYSYHRDGMGHRCGDAPGH
jgi:hypothetical protein